MRIGGREFEFEFGWRVERWGEDASGECLEEERGSCRGHGFW
jgi:hypothetical protein